MTRVLLIGLPADAVDYSDPELPPGITQEKIAAGIESGLAAMRGRGWDAGFCAIRPDHGAEDAIAASLREPWDCIVIGAGVRLPSRMLPLFERAVNAVHRGAPGTPIAFNTSPDHTAEAAERWLKRG